jgi:hypothetical protein
MTMSEPRTLDERLRERAEQRVRSQVDLRVHLMLFVRVNAFLVLIWWLTGAAFFWPVFPIVGWGIGLAVHAWDAYGPDTVTEDRVRREMDRMRRQQ